MSPWWVACVREVFASDILNIVIRGGRRGGKSSTICGRVAVHEVLSDKHVVPPGDFGWFAVLSADKDQAQERLETCHEALKVLGVAHRKTANEITIDNRNVGIKAFAATTTAVVSFTCIGFICDEMAKWRDRETNANPAHKIVQSLRPTMATMPHAKGFYVSSPWSTTDLHHEMVEKGSDHTQLVFVGTSLEMNPTLTAARIEQLEPDEPTRDREYYCIPMPSDETKFFSTEHVDLSVTALPMAFFERVTAGGDMAFRRDSSAMVALAADGFGRFKVVAAEERTPKGRALVPSKTIKDLADCAIKAGADSFACDLHYIETVREHVDDLPIELLEYPSHENDKWYIRTRVLLSEGELDLSEAPTELIAQLKACTSKPLEGGRLKIEVKRNEGVSHGDILSGLVCAVWAMEQPRPEKKPWSGERRFSRGEDSTLQKQLRDLPPDD